MQAQNKVTEKYEAFINDVLKEDLKKVFEERNCISNKLDECINLQKLIENLKEEELSSTPLKVKTDIGCNFYVQAEIPDCKTIYIDIGLGIYVEYKLDEAAQFLKKRVSLYKKDLEDLAKASAKIKAHIKIMLEILYRKEFC